MRSFWHGIKTGVNLKLASNCLTSENKKPYLVCSLQETFAGGAVFWEKTTSGWGNVCSVSEVSGGPGSCYLRLDSASVSMSASNWVAARRAATLLTHSLTSLLTHLITLSSPLSSSNAWPLRPQPINRLHWGVKTGHSKSYALVRGGGYKQYFGSLVGPNIAIDHSGC